MTGSFSCPRKVVSVASMSKWLAAGCARGACGRPLGDVIGLWRCVLPWGAWWPEDEWLQHVPEATEPWLLDHDDDDDDDFRVVADFLRRSEPGDRLYIREELYAIVERRKGNCVLISDYAECVGTPASVVILMERNTLNAMD